MFIGSQHVESPYVEIGAAATGYYFAWFLVVVVPAIGIIENTLMDIALAEGTSSEVVSQKTPAPLLRGWAGPEILLAPAQRQRIKFIRPVLYNILILSTPPPPPTHYFY